MPAHTMECDMATVSLWCGRPLSDYTKEELIEIVERLGAMYANELTEASRQLDILSIPRKVTLK